MAAFTTLAIIAIAGVAVAAYQQHQQGEAAAAAGEHQQQAANSQADLQDYNAQIADLQAKDATARGALAESNYRSEVRGVIGQQRTLIAANNIDVSFGSAVDVQADAAYLGELDALTIRTNAAREAWGYQVQATDLRRRGRIARDEGVYLEAAGQQNRVTANWQAASTVLGGTSSLLSQRYGFQH